MEQCYNENKIKNKVFFNRNATFHFAKGEDMFKDKHESFPPCSDRIADGILGNDIFLEWACAGIVVYDIVAMGAHCTMGLLPDI